MKKTKVNRGKRLTEVEKNALRRVYRSFLNYMEEFEDTLGFTSNDDEDVLDGVYQDAYDLFFKLQHDLNDEYVDLKRTVFDELYVFIDEKLSTTIEWYNLSGPMELDELIAETGAIYQHMMDSFKEIVDKYLV